MRYHEEFLRYANGESDEMMTEHVQKYMQLISHYRDELELILFKAQGSSLENFIEEDPMLVKTEEFKSHFGNDYYVGVLTQCDNHFTKENLTTLRALSNELLDSLSYADKVTSLTDIEFMVGSKPANGQQPQNRNLNTLCHRTMCNCTN